MKGRSSKRDHAGLHSHILAGGAEVKIIVKMLVIALLFVPAKLSAQTPAPLTKADLLFLSSPSDEATAEDLRIAKAFRAAGPEILPLFASIVKENKGNPNLLYCAYHFLNEKIGDNDRTARPIVIENISMIRSKHQGLQYILTVLLGKCGKPEDAPYLLDVLRSSEWSRTKREAAKSLAKIGDAKALPEMKIIYAELQANEPQRLRALQERWNKLVRKESHDTNAVFELPKSDHPYLLDIPEEINKLEKRVGAPSKGSDGK